MSPGQGLPSNSIKVVPGRSKLRVESSNPVPRGGNPNAKSSKVKLISPDEAIKLSSGTGSIPMAVSPISKPARATSEVPKPVQPHRTPEKPKLFQAHRTHEKPKPKVKLISPDEAIKLSSGTGSIPMAVSPISRPASATSEVPKPVQPHRTPEKPKLFQAHRTHEKPKPVQAHQTPEVPKPVQAHQTLEVPKPVQAHPTPEASKPVPARPTSKAPRPVLANLATGSRKEIVCGLRALSMTTTAVRQKKTNPSVVHSKTVEPPSPRALQIRSRVKKQTANATQVVEGTIVEVGDRAKDRDFKEIRQSISDDELSNLLLYRPALDTTWKGRIVDSAMPPEFDCEFWAKPASNIRKKAHRLSKAMPTLLKVELRPTGHILNVFDRSPRLSNVDMYLFPDEKKTERLKGEHAHLFEVMETRNAMISVDINGNELLIFSSKLLDKTSQFIIKTQRKTENFLCGCFLQTKNSQALVPGTSYQTDKDPDDGYIVDMDIDTEIPTPSLVLKLIAGSKNTPLSSSGKVERDGRLPPGFEKIWAPPLVKLNIQGTSKAKSDVSGFAGLVRYQSGQWVFGYSKCHKSISEVAAGILAMYHGLKILWDSGFRRIHLETSLEIIDALTTKSDLFLKRKSILGACKDMILKDWECDIYRISKEQNSCAEWLASRVEGQLQGLVFFEYPPRGLVDLLEKDRLAAI